MSFKIGIMLASFGILMVLAKIADAQTVYLGPELVNTEFSLGGIFVEKSGPVGQQHALKGLFKMEF